jgi:hypothetical protein
MTASQKLKDDVKNRLHGGITIVGNVFKYT